MFGWLAVLLNIVWGEGSQAHTDGSVVSILD